MQKTSIAQQQQKMKQKTIPKIDIYDKFPTYYLKKNDAPHKWPSRFYNWLFLVRTIYMKNLVEFNHDLEQMPIFFSKKPSPLAYTIFIDIYYAKIKHGLISGNMEVQLKL